MQYEMVIISIIRSVQKKKKNIMIKLKNFTCSSGSLSPFFVYLNKSLVCDVANVQIT